MQLYLSSKPHVRLLSLSPRVPRSACYTTVSMKQ